MALTIEEISGIHKSINDLKNVYKQRHKKLKDDFIEAQIKLVENTKKLFWCDIIYQCEHTDNVEFLGYAIFPDVKLNFGTDFLKFEYRDIIFFVEANNNGIYIESARHGSGGVVARFWNLKTGITLDDLIKNIDKNYNKYVKE